MPITRSKAFICLEIEVAAKVTAGRSADINLATSNMSNFRLPNAGNSLHYCQTHHKASFSL